MTYTFPLTLDEVAELLEQSVEKRGEDFIYEPPDGKYAACKYWHKDENKPGCGVGDVLFTAGVPAERLVAADDIVPQQNTEVHTNPVLRQFLDEHARHYLYTFQSEQDDRAPWGEAFEAAEKVRERLIELLSY